MRLIRVDVWLVTAGEWRLFSAALDVLSMTGQLLKTDPAVSTKSDTLHYAQAY